MEPTLSIIIPVFNAEKYLKTCLNSILKQTYEDFEVICINDGSTDSSMEILTEYSMDDSRIKIFTKGNNGPGDARNLAMAKAKGKFITFADSDDTIEPNTYELALKPILSDPDIDIVNFGANIIVEDINANNDFHLNRLKKYHILKHEGKLELNDNILLNTTVSVWNKIFKISIIKTYGISFPIGIIHEDDAFLTKYALVAKNIYFLNKYLYNYIQRPKSLTYQSIEQQTIKAFDRLTAIKDIYDFSQEKGITQQHGELLLYLFKVNTLLECETCTNEQKETLLFQANQLSKHMNLPLNDPLISDLNDLNYSKIIKSIDFNDHN